MPPRDPSAYLCDILEAAAAIQEATGSIDEATYSSTRLIRSAVEREFTIIGEALRVIAQRDPELFAAIPEGRQIIDFRNLLTHEYLKVSDRVVLGRDPDRPAGTRGALNSAAQSPLAGD